MQHDTPNTRHETDHRLDRSADPTPSALRRADDADEIILGAPVPETIHRWLDGEAVTEQELAAPDIQPHVALWAAMRAETGRRRAISTPTHIEALIMANLAAPVTHDD